MQRLSMNRFYCVLGFFILSFYSLKSDAQNDESFRTPAKLYAGAYTVKVQLKKDFTEYDVPFWIKPDQEESVIDASLLKDLGYEDKEIIFQEVKMSGENIEKKKFKNQKTEWAFVPDFAKSCCFGVIGRDILQNYEIRFDPKDPPHLEWTSIVTKNELPSFRPAFLSELRKLFSLSKPIDVPFVLNLQERTLTFEGETNKPLRPTLFSFFFVPPQRVLRVTSILPKNSGSAKKAGFTSGLILTHLNGEKVSELDRWVIEKYLRGEKGDLLKFTTNTKKEFTFDFKTQLFSVALPH